MSEKELSLEEMLADIKSFSMEPSVEELKAQKVKDCHNALLRLKDTKNDRVKHYWKKKFQDLSTELKKMEQ